MATGPGTALEPQIRTMAEGRLAHDFGGVRIHTDERSLTAARELGAMGLAVGQHITLSAGTYPPMDASAWSLLTHELVHTVQQPNAEIESIRGLITVPQNSPSEREAEAVALRPATSISERLSSAAIQRALPPGAGASHGTGPGIDLIFIIKGSSTDEFTRSVILYVKTVLEGQRYEVVDGLDGMFATLGALARTGQRVRRIRLVSHGHVTGGKLSGAVALAPPGETEKAWFKPSDVNAYARRPATREIIHAVMEPGAVVEFWGCNIGGDPRAGQAWATLFQSEFRATPEKFKTELYRYALPALPGQKGRTAAEIDREEGVPLVRDGKYVAGTWVLATSSAEVRARGDEAQRGFEAFLSTAYWALWKNGDIDQLDRNYEQAQALMRSLFDRSHGDIRRIIVERAKSHRQAGPGDQKVWASMWRTFQPVPLGDVAKGAAAEKPAPRIPEHRQPQPPPPAAPPVHRAIPQPVPHAHHTRPAQPSLPHAASHAMPTAPAGSTSEVAWEKEHPAGGVENLGDGRWLLWNFAVSGSDLKPEHEVELDRLAAVLVAARGGSVEVAGHASRTGAGQYNQRLSAQRAEAAMHHLQKAGVRAVTARGVGVLSPIDSGAGPSAMARNRSVEIRLSTVVRAPLPAPRVENPAKWSASSAAQETDPHGIAYYLPGFSIEGKLVQKIPGTPILITPDWLLYGDVEAGLKLEFTTKVPITVAAAFKGGDWDWQLKEDLGRGLKLSANPKKASIQFTGVPSKPEFEVPIFELIRDPEKLAGDPEAAFKLVTAKFTIQPLSWESEEVQLGRRIPALAGIGLKLKFTPKLLVSVGPSPALAARLIAPVAARLGAATPYAAGAVVGVAFAILALYLIGAAHQRGERWAQVVNFRAGYARRLAAEVADWQPRRGISSATNWNVARKETLITHEQAERLRGQGRADFATPFETTYKQVYEGWDEGTRALAVLTPAQYDAAMQALHDRFGSDYRRLEAVIRDRIGGASEDPIGPPADLNLIR